MEHVGPFTGTGPNGGSKENCAVQSSASKWVDWTCSQTNGNGGRHFNLWLRFSKKTFVCKIWLFVKARASAKQSLRQFWDSAGYVLTHTSTPSSSRWTWTRTSAHLCTGEMFTQESGDHWISQIIIISSNAQVQFLLSHVGDVNGWFKEAD